MPIECHAAMGARQPLEPCRYDAGSLSPEAVEVAIQHCGICHSDLHGRGTIREMLELAARHKIGARVEAVPMGEVNRAIQKVRDNKARYWMVLQN